MEVKKVQPEIFDPTTKKTNEQGYDEDGVHYDHCGTECCGKCDTADQGVSDDTTNPN